MYSKKSLIVTLGFIGSIWGSTLFAENFPDTHNSFFGKVQFLETTLFYDEARFTEPIRLEESFTLYDSETETSDVNTFRVFVKDLGNNNNDESSFVINPKDDATTNLSRAFVINGQTGEVSIGQNTVSGYRLSVDGNIGVTGSLNAESLYASSLIPVNVDPTTVSEGEFAVIDSDLT
ncbi:hypothetical protein MLD52_22325 [Puniceicoccaceae bacterium K14]|nr:hypothetical protein [Puniceicoccaceae bacterium K14]